ncbi:MAG: protein kinase, partial [Armatimonadetes bacterium]|nr:protein kinase [Armatimonadota bacterium]
MATTPGEMGMWRPGQRIAGLYHVVRPLGHGGMGVVYQVRHLEWDVDLAVKTLRQELLRRPGSVRDFERECETWIGLPPHAYTVSCYYVRNLEGRLGLFAEFVPGGSLAGAIGSRRLYKGAPDEVLSRLLGVAAQAAWGLHHAHRHSLVHQDVKPANLLLGAGWVCKVTDFGLARAQELAVGVGAGAHVTAMGMTAAYASPEQL